MQFLNFTFPKDIIGNMLNALDYREILSLRCVDDHHNMIVHSREEELQINNKIIIAFKVYIAQKAEYARQLEPLLPHLTGYYGRFIGVLRAPTFAAVTRVLKNVSPQIANSLTAQLANLSLQSEIARTDLDFPIMQLFGGRAAFDELPWFTHSVGIANYFEMKAADMVAPIMRYRSDTLFPDLDLFLVRMEDRTINEYVIQPYFRMSGNKWVTLANQITGCAKSGRVQIYCNRFSIHSDTITEALADRHFMLRDVVTPAGRTTYYYQKLHETVVNKEGGNQLH